MFDFSVTLPANRISCPCGRSFLMKRCGNEELPGINLFTCAVLDKMEKEHLLYDENSESGCFDRHRRFFFASATVVFLLGITTIAALSYTTLTLAHENENLKHEKVCGTPYTHNYANPNIADTALQPKGSLLVKNCHLWTGEPLAAESPVPGLTDVLIQNGTITSIGVGLTAPEGTTVLDAAGHHCTLSCSLKLICLRHPRDH